MVKIGECLPLCDFDQEASCAAALLLVALHEQFSEIAAFNLHPSEDGHLTVCAVASDTKYPVLAVDWFVKGFTARLKVQCPPL